MAGRTVVQAFDRIAPVYDETRDPLEAPALDRLAELLRAGGVARALEIGVGTGRMARPLLDRGIDLTGVDASTPMLARARSKGIERLVRGNAYRLPFSDGAFDAGLFFHVLHLLDDPHAALGEACRVGRSGAFALVHPRSPRAADGPGREELRPRRLVYAQLRAEGVELPERPRSPGAKESRLLETIPPDSLEIVSEGEVTELAAKSLDTFEHRASRHTLDVPPDVMARAVAAARAQLGTRTITYYRVRALAHWRRPPARPADAPPPG